MTRRLPDRRIEGVAARHAPAGEDESNPERPQYVGLTTGRAGAAREPSGDPQLIHRRIDVPVLPKHEADGLSGDRGGYGLRIARQDRTCTLQRLVRARQR